MLQRVIEFGLDNRLLLAVLALLVVIAGGLASTRLPVDAFPDVSPNLVQVFAETEGLAPEEVERYVTYPVEVAMTGLPGVTRVRSVSNFGLSVVNVYFEDGMDVYLARQLVGERIMEARESIPEGFGEPSMGPITTGMGLILFYYLDDATGERSLEELRTLQDWIVKFHLQTVPGVTEVLGIGGHEKQFHIDVRPDRLLRYDVSLAEVVERVRANNLNVGAQFIERNAEELVVRSEGLATGIDDLESIVVKTEHGRPIHLSDVAAVRIGGAVRRGLQTRDGAGEVVAGMVVKLHGENSSAVIARVERKLDEINGILPEGVSIVPYYEQRSLVEAAVGTVRDALLLGVVLVVLVLLLALGGLRPSLVAVLAIPFAMLFALLGMARLGISANLMSLGGLAIAIGMIVDGAIVIVENVDRHLRAAPADAKRRVVVAAACREVAGPIVFAILIIVVVFLPLITLQGVEGKTFRPMAHTLALAMLGSLVFTIALAPLLSLTLMRRPRGDGGEPRIVRWLLLPYRPLVAFCVRRSGVAVLLALALLAAGAAVVPRLGSEYTPRLNEGTVVVQLTMAPSISLTESRRTTMIVERRLLEIPEVRGVVSRIGRGEVGAHTHPVNSAEMFLSLAPRDEWRRGMSQPALQETVRRELGDVPGVQVNIGQPIALAVDHLLEGVQAQLAIKVVGEDLDLLEAKAAAVASVVRGIDGAVDVQMDQVSGAPQLRIVVDRGAIARYGLNVADVQETLRAAVGGEPAGEVFEGVRRYGIVVRFVEEARRGAEEIGSILVPTRDGARVPLSELAAIEEVVGRRQITREDYQRFVSVQCNVVGRDIGGFVAEAREAIAAGVDLPPGYLVTWGGQFRLQQEANRRLALVVPLTLLLTTLLLVGHLRRLRSAALIMLNIPLALTGGAVALWVSGQNLSVPASVGFIALFGIALGNGLVLVNHLDRLVREGMPAREAAVVGAGHRLRPVLMTATTTLFGLLPLLFSGGTGSEVQRPLATVVVGGVISSTLLTLVVLPALYRRFAPRPGPATGGAAE